MDTSHSQEHPSTELQSIKSVVLEMMTQLAQATNLSHQQRIMLLQMETQLHILRERVEKLEAHGGASRARSNGAAAPKVGEVHQRTATSPLPDEDPVKVVQVDQHTATSPLPDLYPVQVPVQVLQATAYAVPLDAAQNNDEVPKKEKNNTWINFCENLRNDVRHRTLCDKLPLSKKSKYASAVWKTMTKEERQAYKIKDPARWPPLPAPCADNIAKALEDGTPAEKAPEKQHKKPAEKAPENKHKRRRIVDDTSSDEDMLGKNDDDD
jgi:hypothetical protein